MSVTEPVTTPSVARHRYVGDEEPDGPGWISRFVSSDPIRATAYALIIINVFVRVQIATRGFLAEDDFVLANRAAVANLNLDFLLTTYNNHLMPAGQLLLWGLSHWFGLEYWPVVLLLAIGQAVLGFSFFRLLRLLVKPGWGLLVPLCLLLFNPLTLDTTSMLAIGMFLLPMELAMVWAIGAQVKYVRTRRVRHLVSLVAAIVFGLAFYEKSLLIVPLVLLVTACMLSRGGPVRSVWRTLRRDWPAWVTLAVVSAGYVTLYVTRPAPPQCDPMSCPPPFGFQATSIGEVVRFAEGVVGTTVIPGLLGGPWRWAKTGGPPLVDSPEVLRWLSWGVLLLIIAGTMAYRRIAGRAWMLLASYVALVIALFSLTRLGAPMSHLVALGPRYVSDVVPLAALCIGIAVLGPAESPEVTTAERHLPKVLREPAAVAVGLVVAIAMAVGLSVGVVSSTARFSDAWANPHAREYLSTVRTELAAAPPGTVFFDGAVPEAVLPVFFWPSNQQSRFFTTLDIQPVYVAEAAHPSVFDATGRIRPATVDGIRAVPGPVTEISCGHRVGEGETAKILMAADVPQWEWVVQFGYLSNGESPATFQLGTARHQFTVHEGLNQILFKINGGGGKIAELTLTDPDVSLCTNEVIVGNPVPKP